MLIRLLVTATVLLLSACVPNQSFRTEFVQDYCFEPGVDCDSAVIERHLIYDLAFIEFTERGNLYNRSSTRHVMNLVGNQADRDEGVALFVYVHGWKHNASAKDSNVIGFKQFLSNAAENELVGKRKVIGIYIGWRGKTTSLPFIRETSYWGRKSVAEEIGGGGATEVLSELHQIVAADSLKEVSNAHYKNTYIVIGHSFGGAIVLSAMHDVLLNNLIAATAGQRASQDSTQRVKCKNIKRFADGIFLVNPAIEANKVVLLKEAAGRCQFPPDQASLIRILSTDADTATKLFFPAGQYLNLTNTLSPKKLNRTIDGKELVLDERKLDRTTAGNLPDFRTALLTYTPAARSWEMTSCKDRASECGAKKSDHFPIADHDPIEFIYTDKYFMKDHNDMFGCPVRSFITASIQEIQSASPALQKRKQEDATGPELGGCNSLKFDFQRCLNSQMDENECVL